MAVAAATSGPAAAAKTGPLVAREATQDSGTLTQRNQAGQAAGTGNASLAAGTALPAADTASASVGTVLDDCCGGIMMMSCLTAQENTAPLLSKICQHRTFITLTTIFSHSQKPFIPGCFIGEQCPGNGSYLRLYKAHDFEGIVNSRLQLDGWFQTNNAKKYNLNAELFYVKRTLFNSEKYQFNFPGQIRMLADYPG